MSKTLLISFIGKATRNKNSQESGGKSIGYESVEYVFQDGTTYKTSFFPVAVYKYLIEKENKNPDIDWARNSFLKKSRNLYNKHFR